MPPSLPGLDIVSRPVGSVGQVVLEVVVAAAIAALVVVAARIRRRWRTSMGFVVLLAALLGSGVEVVYNTASDFWYYQPHADGLFSTWGRTLPAWALGSYVPFYGGLGLLGWWLLERGARRAALAWYAAGVWAFAVATEACLVGIHLYTYYGPQPYQVAGFPAWVSAANSAICTSMAVGAARLARATSGPRQWLLIAGGPPLISGCLIGTTFPMVSVLHGTHPSQLALYIGGAAATLLAALLITTVLGLVPKAGLAGSLIPGAASGSKPGKEPASVSAKVPGIRGTR
jgi:hypothetical protein